MLRARAPRLPAVVVPLLGRKALSRYALRNGGNGPGLPALVSGPQMKKPRSTRGFSV
jgi:hypothetical protein